MAINEKSLANLRPPLKGTEEARQRGRNGGIKSGQVRRAKKRMKDSLAMLLDLPPGLTDQRDILTALGIAEEDCNNQTLIAVARYRLQQAGTLKPLHGSVIL